ncbi:aminoacyl-tRNA hydrolase [Phosphitispora sp. TUW77]|uniref:aminoacyl-tRNA hydrolase n=1 Tax=Phosphitispora sp. TUW77 TaxID=3152361 RepID=UPI003AB5C431
MKLIIGLGNPGSKYASTRHNVGFMVIDYLAGILDISVDRTKFKSLIGEGFKNGEKIVLAKPQTYMNLSGEAVLDMVHWYKIDLKDILVIYDDMDLPLGKLRLRIKGGAGGHNGMKSIIYLAQSEEFPRLRIGLGRPEAGNLENIDFVLGKLSDEEAKVMKETIKEAGQAVLAVIDKGAEQAMNEVNKL